MALNHFIKAGSYTRINQISIQKENPRVDFEIKVYESDGGGKLFGPLYFSLSLAEELKKYKDENLDLPVDPVYPTLCSDREALVPMWTDESTDEEKAAYDAALAAYEQAVEAHGTSCTALVTEVETAAETENEYSKHFSDQKIYTDSNATACAYLFLKGLPGFEGVEDA